MQRIFPCFFSHVFLCSAVLLLSPFGVSVFAQELSDAEKNDGWVSLFDGKTLDGWECNEEYDGWSVKDGEIVAEGKYCHLFFMKEKYRNFELKIDVKINKGGNSGVYIKVPERKSGWPVTGFELQVNSSHGDPVKTGSLYNIIKIFKAPHGDDEWFTYHLTAKGNTLTVAVNGTVLYQYVDPLEKAGPAPEKTTESTKRISQEGYIALQHHDPGTHPAFKNIKVKKLD